MRFGQKFNATPIVLLDNNFAVHASNLVRLFRALLPERQSDIQHIPVADTTPPLIAQVDVRDLLSHLKEINTDRGNIEYVMLPVGIGDTLARTRQLVQIVAGQDIPLIPQNLKEHQEVLLDCFKAIAEHPEAYLPKLEEMADQGLPLSVKTQDLPVIYDLIQEINRCVENGIKIFMAGGQGYQIPYIWMDAGKESLPELTHFIATGESIDDIPERFKQEIRDNGSYAFNFLELSNGRKLSPLNAHGKPHLFASDDTLITDYARGAYNLTPVRDAKTREVVGLSYTGDQDIHYTLEEFPWASSIRRFVGLPVEDVLASASEHAQLKSIYRKSDATEADKQYMKVLKGKLFRVSDVFSAEEIRQGRLNLRGDYVNSNGKLFFKLNQQGRLIHPESDYEGSGRPGIVQMFGACLATVKAVVDDLIGFPKKRPSEKN